MPDYELTRSKFSKIGLSDAETEALIASGYIMIREDTVIDRYYGGPKMSYDSRTRFHIDHFLDVLKNGKSHVPVVSAGSMLEVRKIVDGWQNKISKRLLFRGQTGSYPTVRKHPNPFFQFEHFGEVSLVPSLWREMLKTKPDHYPSFAGLGPLDWSAVIYDQFDMPEIERRHKALLDAGEWIYSAQDMADSDDPLLQEFGNVRLDLLVGYDMAQPVRLNTLLQHYGLLSPLLDLTIDLNVALYFAGHTGKPIDGKYRYSFVGNNDRRSVLYVLYQDNTEMLEHDHARVIHKVHALRPIRQSCVVSQTGALALNLPADFLVGIIKLDFEHDGVRKYKTGDLFPSKEEDVFLSAMLRKLRYPDRVSEVV